MRLATWIFFCAIFSLWASAESFAPSDDNIKLDPPPSQVVPVETISPFVLPLARALSFGDTDSNDLNASLALQTPVKNQGGRGTCSIFSATALLESLIKAERGELLDLSENYLEYLVMGYLKNPPQEGSDVPWNITAFARYGTIPESVWPYSGNDWTKGEVSGSEAILLESECGALEGARKTACLLGHMNPAANRYAAQAAELFRTYRLSRLGYQPLRHQYYIKSELNASHPLILSIEFFYGAWNHGKMVSLGIGERSHDNWVKGSVGIPTAEDIRLSRTSPAGHSILIVGYDDAKQVYYFKNSWGTDSFGRETLVGETPAAGYGTISYTYAHQFGTFYSVKFNQP